VHAGILADLRLPDHVQQLADLGIAPFELVVVNLYPFAETVASGASVDECVEQIDIGGPTMVRAAAKNAPSVAVVVDPSSYADVLAAVQDGGTTVEQRRLLAVAAFRHTASYDIAVASWMGAQYSDGEGFPAWVGASWNRADVLRYGENPHQAGALYTGFGAGWPRRSCCTASRCPTTTTSTVTLPGGPRTTTATLRRWRSSSTPTPVASRWAPTPPRRTARRTPATPCRRSAASSPPT
jgi:hypothetical protein